MNSKNSPFHEKRTREKKLFGGEIANRLKQSIYLAVKVELIHRKTIPLYKKDHKFRYIKTERLVVLNLR